MSLRLIAAVVVAVLFALTQMSTSLGGVSGTSNTTAQPAGRSASSVALAQEDNEEDNEDENEEDNEDENEEDNEEDNEDCVVEDDEDNEDNEEDNEDCIDEDNDDGDVAPAPARVATTLPDVPASGTSNGGDVAIMLGGERLVVKMFPWMERDITITVRRVDPATVTSMPARRVGDLLFFIEARNAAGTQLGVLPAEINLSVRYNNEDLAGLSDANLMLSRQDPVSGQWVTAPKLYQDGDTNYIASSTMELGLYLVHVP